MGVLVVIEALRRRWRSKLVGLLTVAFGVAVLGALLHLATQGEDRLALDLRGYGPNLVVRPAADRHLTTRDVHAIKTIFWRNNVTGLAPELSLTVECGGFRFPLVGAWLDRAMRLDDAPDWHAGLVALHPSWNEPGVIEGTLPGEADGVAEMLVGARLAASRGWGIGDVVDVARGERSAQLVVSGILRTGDAWEDQALTAIEPVQRLLGREDAIGQILVSALAKPDDELSRRGMESLSNADKERMICSPYLGTIAHEIEQAIPGSGVEPIRRVSEAESEYRSRLQALLGLLAASAAALTCLGVYGSVRSALAQRRTEMGLLQALGARTSTIAALFLGEGLAMGLVGGLSGSLLGFGLASILSRVVFGEPLVLTFGTTALLVTCGLLLSAIGSGLAIRGALRSDTVSLLRSAT
jgi:putative ABC transport system permease protein